MLLPNATAHKRIYESLLSKAKVVTEKQVTGTEASTANRETVLDVMRNAPEPMSYAELRKATGLSTPTLRRHLTTLGAQRYQSVKNAGRVIWELPQEGIS